MDIAFNRLYNVFQLHQALVLAPEKGNCSSKAVICKEAFASRRASHAPSAQGRAESRKARECTLKFLTRGGGSLLTQALPRAT